MAEQGEAQGAEKEPRPPKTPSLDHQRTGGTFQNFKSREGHYVEKGEVITRSTREKNGRFTNPWPTWHYPSSASLLRFYLLDKDHSNVPRSKEDLDSVLPVLEPYFIQSPEVSGAVGSGLRVTWLGHASVLVEMDGLVILTDPIFSQRAFLVQFMGPKRFRGPPCTVDQLPKVDAVLVSHTHYDHLDAGSVSSLNKRFGAELRWFVPLGLQGWMQSCGCKNVIALDWWEESCVPVPISVPSPVAVPSGGGQDKVLFIFTPAQHWCKRTPTDDNRVLWGSWSVLGPCNRFFFAGDTGYCSSFQEIGRRFGPFDLAAIPIGAYLPRDVMKSLHVDPEEAVEIHKDVQAKHSLAIHWGTFTLAHEYYLEPPMRLREAMEKNGLNVDHFFVLNHGESRVLGGEIERGGVFEDSRWATMPETAIGKSLDF